VPEARTDRTPYLGLLALMIAGADSQGWGFPYWNQYWLDAALSGLAQAVRDGSVPLAAPASAPTAGISASAGIIPGEVALEIAQTFVDEFGRETEAGPVALVTTPVALVDPLEPPTLGTPTLGGASGYEGGLLEIWFSWTDGAGGETLASPGAQVEVPYQAGGLKSEVALTLPSTPAFLGAAGANIYIRHRGGNVVLAYRIETDDVDEITLTGAVADCERSIPLARSTGSINAIDITGASPVGEHGFLTRFYIRPEGSVWTSQDSRLRIGGVEEWDPATVEYPLLYTGSAEQSAPGYPPPVSQVKALRPLDLGTEVIGTLDWTRLPDEAALDTELALPIGDCLLSGFLVTAHTPADMAVDVATGVALIAAGMFAPGAIELAIPTADPTLDRIDIICLADDGTIEGPTENANLKGTPGAEPSAPTTPAGYLIIAEIYVTHAEMEISTPDITDSRVLLTTLVDETAARVSGDEGIAGDLNTHAADAEAHASKAHLMDTVNQTCPNSMSTDFTVPNMESALVTSVRAVATSSGAIDYDLYLYEDSGRTVLAYQAGEGSGAGIQQATFLDRVPWEWFGGTAIYARVTNYSAADISNLALTIRYRK